MNILALDPGATSGWCLYVDGRALDSGQFCAHDITDEAIDYVLLADVVVIESFAEVHGVIYPQTVTAAGTCGRLIERVERLRGERVHELTRHAVKCTLHAAIHREFPVGKERDVWAALLLLHGGEAAAKKGGPLHGVKAHERAALAVAVAWELKRVESERITEESKP